MKNKLFDEEDIKFIQKINLIGILSLIACWYLIITEKVVMSGPKSEVFSISFNFERWGAEMFTGAIYPLAMISELGVFGIFILLKILLGLLVFCWNKPFGLIILASAMWATNYLASGLLIKPFFMIGTMLAPIATVIYLLAGAVAVVADEVKNIAKRMSS